MPTDTLYEEFLATQAANRAQEEEEARLADEGKVKLMNGAILRKEAYEPDERRALRMLDSGRITREEYVSQHGPIVTRLRRS